MDEQQKYLAGVSISLIAALLTVPTVIGPIFFGLLALGMLIKWYEAKHDERPWWTKSLVTLWRERGDDADE